MSASHSVCEVGIIFISFYIKGKLKLEKLEQLAKVMGGSEPTQAVSRAHTFDCRECKKAGSIHLSNLDVTIS